MAIVDKRGSSRLYYLLLLVLSVISIGHLSLHARYTMDDAYISFRYASNLANGLGLVYNPGEFVKGYSNTLWTVLMAVPEKIGASPLYLAKGLGAGSFACLLFLLVRFASDGATVRPEKRVKNDSTNSGQRSTRPRSCWSLLPALLISVSAPTAVWFMSGLETGLYTCLAFLAVTLRLHEQKHGRRWPLSALAFVAVVWCRPEGIIFFVAMSMHDLVYRTLRRMWSFRELFWYAGPVAAYLFELWWSNYYYGDPLPNTFYVKTPVAEGVSSLFWIPTTLINAQLDWNGYIVQGIIRAGGYGIVVLGAISLLRRERLRENAAFALAIAAQMAFIVRTGGDWMPAYRFLVPVAPFVAVLLAEAVLLLSAYFRFTPSRAQSALFAGVFVLALVPGNFAISRHVAEKKPVTARNYLKKGKSYDSLLGPGRSVAAFDVGGIGYALRGEILDTCGLTDRFIAKTFYRSVRACVEYALLKQPDLIRRHPSGKRQPDEGLCRVAIASRQYLPLGTEWLLVRRGLVLIDQPPPEARRLDGLADEPAPQVVAYVLPSVVREGQRVTGTLFWKRPRDHTGSAPARTFFLDAEGNAAIPLIGDSIIANFGDQRFWSGDDILVDTFTFDAPFSRGQYPLSVRLDNADARQAIATLKVIGHDAIAAQVARQLTEVSEFQSRDEWARALTKCQQAMALSPSASDTCSHLVVEYATEKRLEAASLDSPRAIAVLNNLLYVLRRTFYEIGRASPALQSAVNAVAADRMKLIDARFASHDP